MNIGQRNLLIDFDTIDNWVPKQKIKGTGVLHLSIPVRSYVYEIMTDKRIEDDFIKKTVDDLYAYYKNGDDNHDIIVNKISSDLCLNRDLIVAILKNSGQNETIEDDTTPCRKRYVIFFDLIRNELLPYVISNENYETSYKAEVSPEGNFKKNISSSKEYNFQCLDMKNDNPPYQLPAQMVKDFLNRRGKNAIGLPTFCSGDEEEIGFACFYTAEDLNNFVASHPFHNGLADWIAEDVRIYYEKNKTRDNRICKKLDEIKSKVKSLADVENSEKMSIQQQNIEEIIKESYDVETLNRNLDLKVAFINEITEFYEVMALKNEYRNDEDFDEDKIRDFGKEYYRALFTLIEKILRHSFKRNFKEEKREEYLEYIENIDDYDFSDFIFLAKDLGFLDINIKPTEVAKKNSLHWWINNKDNDSTDAINPLLCVNMIEAYFDEEHPIRMLARVFPDAIELIYKLREKRNIANHSDKKVKVDFFLTEYQRFVEGMFNLLVMHKKQGRDLLVDKAKTIELDVRSIKNQRNLTREKAMTVLDNFANLVECETVYRNAIATVSEFENSHHGYFARAKTTVEEALYQLIHSLFNGDEIDKNIMDERLQNNYDGQHVLDTVNSILKEYDYIERFSKTAGIEPLKDSLILNGKLMLRLKSFCFIIVADRKYSVFLRKFLKENPHFVSIIEELDKNSEHNKQVDFNNKDYEKLHENMLKLCENMCAYINKLGKEEE